jgi:hypothetical protein
MNLRIKQIVSLDAIIQLIFVTETGYAAFENWTED